MKIRVNRALLCDSMETVADILPTAEAIAEYLRAEYGGLVYGVYPEAIRVEPYCFDERINWNTYIVLLNGRAVGFTDGPLKKTSPHAGKRSGEAEVSHPGR